MEGIRRQYSEEFKKDAVGHSLTSEKTVEEVARDLGIAHSNLRRWRASIAKMENWPSPEMVSRGSPPKKRRSEG